MKFLLFSLPGCYPCERASKVLRDNFSEIPVTLLSTVVTPLAEIYEVKMSPTLVVLDSDDNVVGKLIGAHEITKIEVQGLISDFLNC